MKNENFALNTTLELANFIYCKYKIALEVNNGNDCKVVVEKE